MAQTTGQRRDAARELATRIYVSAGKTAALNLDDLLAAVGSIDNAMDALPSTLNPARTVKQNFLDNLPEPFKSISTTQEKALALMVWALKEVGII